MAYVDLLNAKVTVAQRFTLHHSHFCILNANPKNIVPAILGFLNLPDAVWQIELTALLWVIIYPLHG